MGIQINGQTDTISAFDNNFSLAGNVSIGGTLTYEDVTSVDAVGLSTFQAGINISGGNLQVGGTNVINSGRVLYNLEQLKLADTKQLVLGSSDDLKIYHSGSHSFISEEGAGALKIKGDDIRFEDAGGTEALRIDSAGKIGVGDATPENTLSIKNIGSFEGDANSFYLGSNFTGTGQNFSGSGKHAQRFFFNNASSNGYLKFENTGTTGNAGDAITWQERFRIRADGTIRIGGDYYTDTSIQMSLKSSATGCQIQMHGTGTGTASGDGLRVGYNGSGGQMWLFESGYIRFATSNVEKLRITDDGKLLKSGQAQLTSTSLSHPIQVASASDANAIAVFGRAADDIGELSFYEADKTTKLGELQYRQDHVNFRCRVGDIRFASGGTSETLRIDGSGRIAQGGKTPTNHGSPNLLIWGSDPTIHLTSTGSTANTSYTGIKFAVAGGSTGDYSKAGIFVQRQDSYNDLDMIFAFRSTNDAAGVAISDEKLRITSDGKTGIGGINPQHLLSVNSSGSMGLYGTVTAKTGYSIRFIRKYGSGSTNNFATINGASPQGQSRLAGFVATYTFRSAYGFDSAGGGHGVRMLSGRVRDSGEWDFDTETDFGTGDSPRPTLQGVDNSNGTCTLQVVNPSSTHSYGEFHIVTWDCEITSPSS